MLQPSLFDQLLQMISQCMVVLGGMSLLLVVLAIKNLIMP